MKQKADSEDDINNIDESSDDYVYWDLQYYLRDTHGQKGCHSWRRLGKGYVIYCGQEEMRPEVISQMLDAYYDLKEQVERTAHLHSK